MRKHYKLLFIGAMGLFVLFEGTSVSTALAASSPEPQNEPSVTLMPEEKENQEEQTAKVRLKQGMKFTASGFTYVVTKGAVQGKTAEIAILKYSGKKKSLSLGTKTITEQGVKCRIVCIRKKAFFKNRRLRSVVFGKSLQRIGAKAFYGCRNLTYIRVKGKDPDSIVVGDKAFYGTNRDSNVFWSLRSEKQT